MEGRMEADSSRSEQSAESRGSCSEEFGSRSCGQILAEASESGCSAEDLANDEWTNWRVSQFRSLSHHLIHSTKVKENMITTAEFDLRSTLDSEAGGSLKQSESINHSNGMILDRIEDRHMNSQYMNTGG